MGYHTAVSHSLQNHRTSTIRGGRRRGNISPPTCSCPGDLCDLFHWSVITPGLLEVSALRFVTHTVRLVRLRFLLLTEPKSLSRIGSRSSVVLINSISYSLLLYSRFLTSFLCLHPSVFSCPFECNIKRPSFAKSCNIWNFSPPSCWFTFHSAFSNFVQKRTTPKKVISVLTSCIECLREDDIVFLFADTYIYFRVSI